MKTDRLSIRVTEEEKKISLEADKYSMSTSEYVVSAVKEKMQVDKINDSQSKFLKLFDVAFQKAFDPYFKRIMVINNRIEFNTRWQLKQQDIFMQHLKVPQTKEDLNNFGKMSYVYNNSSFEITSLYNGEYLLRNFLITLFHIIN